MTNRCTLRPSLAVAAVLFLVVGCAPPDREAEVRAFLSAAVAAAEARDTGFFRAHIDAAYADASGRSRDDVVGMLRAFFFVNSRVEVLHRINRIEVIADDFAMVEAQAALIGNRDQSRPFDIDAELIALELELARGGSDWMVIGARWGRLLE